MTQKKFLSQLLEKNKRATIVGSLGTISKDLEELNNGQNCILPAKGAMGCVMGMGLGIALSVKNKVIVVIGDGAFLMKAGSVATILRYKPKNLEIIILNNNKYASCGGQETNFRFYAKGVFSRFLSHFNGRTHQVFEVVNIT